MRKAQGLSYQTDIAVFEMERDRLFAQSGGLEQPTKWAGASAGLLGGVNIPESGFGGQLRNGNFQVFSLRSITGDKSHMVWVGYRSCCFLGHVLTRHIA